METPDSTPSAEAEAETYLTGQVVPKASGSDQAEFDAPEPDDDPQAASGPVWRFLFEPTVARVASVRRRGVLGNAVARRLAVPPGHGGQRAKLGIHVRVAAVRRVRRRVLGPDDQGRVHVCDAAVSPRLIWSPRRWPSRWRRCPRARCCPQGTLPEGVIVRQLERPDDEEEDDPELASLQRLPGEAERRGQGPQQVAARPSLLRADRKDPRDARGRSALPGDGLHHRRPDHRGVLRRHPAPGRRAQHLHRQRHRHGARLPVHRLHRRSRTCSRRS